MNKQSYTAQPDNSDTINNIISAATGIAGTGLLLHDPHSVAGGALAGGTVGQMLGYHGAKLFDVDKQSRFAAALLLSIAGSVAGGTIAKNAALATIADKKWPYVTAKQFYKLQTDTLLDKSKSYWKPGLLGAALLAAGTLAIQGKDAKAWHVAGAGAAGYAAANLGMLIKDMLKGPAYQRQYNLEKIKPGQDVVVAFNGVGTGNGNLDRQLYKHFGPGNYAIFSHWQHDKFRDFVNSLPEKTKAHLIGFSWGGNALADTLPGITHKNIETHFIDPVGWDTNLADGSVPGNKYTPSNKDTFDVSQHGYLSNIYRTLGGGHTYSDSIPYKGQHSDIEPVLAAIAKYVKDGSPLRVE